jgi:hypothetical protein
MDDRDEINGRAFALQRKYRFETAEVFGELAVLRLESPTRHQSASP